MSLVQFEYCACPDLQHSIDNNLNRGTGDGCWKSTQFSVDESSLFDSDIYSSAPDISTINAIKCIIWLTYATWFICMVFGAIAVYCGDFCTCIVNMQFPQTTTQSV